MDQHEQDPPADAPTPARRRIPTVYIVTAAVILVVTLVQVSLLFL